MRDYFSKFYRSFLTEKYLFFSMFFTLILVIVNYCWIKLDIAPPPWDQAWYLENSQIIYHAWTEGGALSLLNAFAHAFNGVKAPLIAILPLPFYLVLGNAEVSAMFVNLMFMVLFTFFFYRLVENLSNKKIAFLSTIASQTMPLFVGMSRQFFVEYGLATLIVMYLYFLIKSDYFQNKKYNFLTGIFLGLGLLFKVSFPLYVVAPTLWIFYLRMKSGKRVIERAFLIVVFKILLIAFLVSAIWYVPNFNSVIGFAISAGVGDIAANYGSKNIFSWEVVYGYWRTLVNVAVSSYYYIAFIVALLLYFGISFLLPKEVFFKELKNELISSGALSSERQKGKIIKRGYTRFLSLWFFIPLFALTFSINKDYRYVLPILPVMAIFISVMLYKLMEVLKSVRFYPLACVVFLLFPIFNLWHASFIDTSIPRDFKSVFTPDKRDFKTAQIVEYLYRETYKLDNPSGWSIVALEHPSVNYNTYSYFASLKNYTYPIRFSNLGYKQMDFNDVLGKFNYFNPDFVLIEDGMKKGELEEWINLANNEVEEMLINKKLPFVKDRIFELENGAIITVYKKDFLN